MFPTSFAHFIPKWLGWKITNGVLEAGAENRGRDNGGEVKKREERLLTSREMLRQTQRSPFSYQHPRQAFKVKERGERTMVLLNLVLLLCHL